MRALVPRLMAGVLAMVLVAGFAVTPANPVIGAQDVDDIIAQVLPPGGRELLAAVRVFKGLSARNRVYREAKRVQRDLQAYYDARIETAQRMLLDREHLGLRDSQVIAYQRVKASLEAEREAALQLTENEKRAAKYAFESKLRRQLFSALLRTPKAQTALRGVRDTLRDVRDGFGRLQAALEGQNPVAIYVQDIQDKVDKVRAAGQVMTMLGGDAGAQIIRKAEAVQTLIDDANSATALASQANGEIVGALDGAIDSVQSHLKTSRRPRAAGDVLTDVIAAEMAERIFTPGGEVPVEDIVADVIARGYDPDLVRSIGVAVGAIDPETLATMRERVRARLLSDKLDSIAEVCGRFTGAEREASVAALGGDGAAPEVVPCTLFRNPQALADFVARMARPEPGEVVVGRFDGAYRGDELIRPTGAIVDIIDTDVRVDIEEDVLAGSVVQVAVTVYSDGEGEWAYTKTEEATQIIGFADLVDASGAFDATGTTKASYVLLSCEPEDPEGLACEGVGPTRSARPEGVEVAVSGLIDGPRLEALIVNSVSNAQAEIIAYKEDAP